MFSNRLAIRTVTAAAVALSFPATVLAQTDGPPVESVFDGDHLTVGIGAGYAPTYEGSDNYDVFPFPLIQGNLRGIAITPRPGGVALDFIADGPDARVGYSLGPTARIRRNRVSDIKDPAVRALGKLDTAVEVGINGGISFYKVFHDYDSITVSSDVQWDVAGAHKGMVISPSVSYFTPLSRAAIVNIAVSADRVDDDYADYYFSLAPGNAAGLPAFDADGGWKSVGVSVVGGLDLDGDATNGGFGLFVIGGYSRMLGDFKRTPLTSVRGDADQWLAGAGVAYTF